MFFSFKTNLLENASFFSKECQNWSSNRLKFFIKKTMHPYVAFSTIDEFSKHRLNDPCCVLSLHCEILLVWQRFVCFRDPMGSVSDPLPFHCCNSSRWPRQQVVPACCLIILWPFQTNKEGLDPYSVWQSHFDTFVSEPSLGQHKDNTH